MKVIVNVSLKEGVLDPEGQAIKSSLNNLGFENCSDVRTGKQIILNLNQNNEDEVLTQAMKMCEELDNGMRAFPATAQVAKQQGNYLAEIFNSAKENGFEVLQDPNARFNYEHKGSLAYIGKDSAVADIPGFAILKGLAAGLVWKSFETVSQVSVNNVFKVAADILRTKIFGRDISRLS